MNGHDDDWTNLSVHAILDLQPASRAHAHLAPSLYITHRAKLQSVSLPANFFLSSPRPPARALVEPDCRFLSQAFPPTCMPPVA